MRTKICISGKNNIAVDIAEYILHNHHDVDLVAIFNKNDNGKNGFQRSFKSFCNINNIQEVSLDDVYEEKELIFLSLEFDKIIKPELFKTTELFNIHFSLLPEYKGMYTSALPILHGNNYTGVTLHKIDRGIDTGDILDQVRFEITDHLKSEELYKLYTSHGTEIIKKNINSIIAKQYLTSKQDANKSTYYSVSAIDYRNLKIDLNQTAFKIQRQINAFYFPSYQIPVVNGFEIYNTDILPEKSNVKPGKILKDEQFFLDISTIDYNIRLYKDLRNKLFDAAKEGNIAKLTEFVKAGYDLHQRSKEGWDISIIAAYNDQYQFLDYLFENLHWNSNIMNNNGTTLMMYLMTRASFNSNLYYLEKFIEKNTSYLSLCDFNGKNIWQYAHEYANEKVINLLDNYK
ncbi:formyltransferase family protein [Chryseobacterium sp. MYb264]|uniref:formyltransferase family protein n=1 Tax=Chryseobacterium sp. MYb264 TaxID=2745153 RepID=UPI002E10B666|nr:formyltransferase family protein [Chryseobacterium sp. MYb264]